MEMVMQYVWQYRLWPMMPVTTVDGRRLTIIDPGQINRGSGPDFFNAKIDIDGKVWAGNVELHDRASDWHRHHHDGDAAYDSVVLHVVNRDDTMIRRTNGEVIAQVVMPNAEEIRRRSLALTGGAPGELSCAATLASMPRLLVCDWISSLGFERLNSRSDKWLELAGRLNGDWEGVAFVALARAMGFGTNSDPFELMAMSVPFKVVQKHVDNVESVEALLFGQAGLLEGAPADNYQEHLKQEYEFMAHKYGLRAIDSGSVKTGRMRPANFPHRRIAALARFLILHQRLMSDLSASTDYESAMRLFEFQLAGYWVDHHRFGGAGSYSPNALSAGSARLLIINALVPVVHAWAIDSGDFRKADAMAELLQGLPGEDNSMISVFKSSGVECPDAFTSQALLHLRREYCLKRKCIYCRIGHRHLSGK